MKMETDMSAFAREYKRRVPGRFMLVDGSKLEEKIGGQDLFVTKKLDGVMQIICYEDGVARAFGTGGSETPHELPCLSEMTALLQSRGITSALLAAELYAPLSATGRERVCDVAAALVDEKKKGELRLAAFDLLEIDDDDLSGLPVEEKMQRLRSLLRGGIKVTVVQSRLCPSVREVRQLYESQVVRKGAEGLVVHSSNGFVYKVKPRHTIDVAVIGYTEGEGEHHEKVRDLLTGVIATDGTLRQIVSVGGGMTEQERADLFNRLKNSGAESEYFETDSRGVAFQMVRPEIVIEISAVDFVTENSAGDPKQNMLLDYDNVTGYKAVGKAPGVSLHSATFVRERTDKTVCREDVREGQITDLCEFSKGRTVDYSALPASTVLVRRVYKKTRGLRTAVHKFVVWKTNKEQTGTFPAYVLHHTDYNYSRGEQLRRDLRASDSLDQIMMLLDEMILLNIKKGWEEII
ncbi:MAG: hypothetical protein K2K76_10895 [Muribaculaceae bacterium]|nr:hypothetical protein [Muribaculaceae bacterium]